MCAAPDFTPHFFCVSKNFNERKLQQKKSAMAIYMLTKKFVAFKTINDYFWQKKKLNLQNIKISKAGGEKLAM